MLRRIPARHGCSLSISVRCLGGTEDNVTVHAERLRVLGSRCVAPDAIFVRRQTWTPTFGSTMRQQVARHDLAWKERSAASPPQRASHIAPVSPLSHQRGGWPAPGQASQKALASGENPLCGWRFDHIVPTPRVSSSLSAPRPDGGGRGALRRLLGPRRGQTRRRSSPRPDRTVTGHQRPRRLADDCDQCGTDLGVSWTHCSHNSL